jgi:putative ubiquitin-RnfH superfamily antitoxin RatB of RatAB toxin-antitoxin module
MSLTIEVAYSPAARTVQRRALTLPDGSTVADALQAAGLSRTVAVQALEVGVWGRPRRLDDMLRDGDRVEVWRALRVDPKEARRLRYTGQRRRAKKPPVGAGR